MLKLDEWDAQLARVVPPGSLYAVGGRVRDELRAELHGVPLTIKDADYVVVGLSYDELEARLAPLGSVDRVGASFSVIKLTREGMTVDIALPRREISTGTGHREFQIESGPEVALEDDLERRDFRMNMIARALPGGELLDPHNGVADIAARRIDIVHAQTFDEDPLRLLRACQFAARFEYTLSPRTQAAMLAAAPLVRSISPQRIGEEFAKFLTHAQRPSIAIELMRQTGILKELWPELLEGFGVEQNEWHAFDVYYHNLATLDAVPVGDLIARLSALLHDVGKPRVKDGPHFYRHEFVGEELSRDMLLRVQFPHAVIDEVCHLVRHHMYCADPHLTDAAVRRFIRRVGSKSLDPLFALRAADIVGSGLPKRSDDNERFQARVQAEVQTAPALAIRDLALDGHAVMQAFRTHNIALAPHGDRRVGAALAALFELVTDEPSRNTCEALETYLNQYIQNLGR